MGIYAHRFYFKDGLPPVKVVTEKFQEITGLRIQFYSIAHIGKFLTDSSDLLYHLRKVNDETNSVAINAPYFSCPGFNRVYLGDYLGEGDKTFYLEFGVGSGSLYVYRALIKSMLEVGGLTYTNHIAPDEEETDAFIQPYLEPYNPHDREWKQIRRWAEMSDFEKASFEPTL